LADINADSSVIPSLPTDTERVKMKLMQLNPTVADLESILPVRSSALLADFTDEELGVLASSLQMLTISKGQMLFHQEEPGDSLYIILLGQVAIQREYIERGQVKQRNLAVVGAGECVGEVALADGGPRSASVVTLEAIEVLKLTTDNYEQMKQNQPSLAIKLMMGLLRLLSKRLRQINNTMETAQLALFSS